jgi:hypothetical protein
MNKVIFLTPAIRPPKCKDCKWSARFNEDTLICTTFNVKPKVQSQIYDFTYLLDTEYARGHVHFCGYYGTHFEPKE